MKAIVYEEFGGPDEVLHYRDVADPAVGDDEALVRIHAAAPNPYDWHFMRGEPLIMRLTGIGLRRPRKPMILGSDMAGTVSVLS